MNKSAVFWFEFYSKRFGPWPFISGVTSDKDMPLKTNPPSKLFVVMLFKEIASLSEMPFFSWLNTYFERKWFLGVVFRFLVLCRIIRL